MGVDKENLNRNYISESLIMHVSFHLRYVEHIIIFRVDFSSFSFSKMQSFHYLIESWLEL